MTGSQIIHGMKYGGRVNPGVAIGTSITTGVVGFGSSVALGKIYGQYSEGDKWYNKFAKHSPAILGGVGKLLEGVLIWQVGQGFASGIAGSLGNTGLNAIGLELGLKSAQKALDIVCVKVPAGTAKALKKGGTASGTVVGHLPPAAAGHGLVWDHIQDLASSH